MFGISVYVQKLLSNFQYFLTNQKCVRYFLLRSTATSRRNMDYPKMSSLQLVQMRIQGSSKHLKLDKDLSDQFYNNETVFRKASDTFKLSFLRHNLCLTSCLTNNLSSCYTHKPQKFQFNSQVHLIPHRLLIFASAT